MTEEAYLKELDFRAEGHARLTETSLNKINLHSKNGMIIISANKSDLDNVFIRKEYRKWLKYNNKVSDDYSEKEFLKVRNKKCDTELYRWLKSDDNPYYYIPVYGGYKSEGNVKDIYEPSFIVFCEKSLKKTNFPVSWDDLYSKALEWCRKYCQDSVYIQPPGENPYYVDYRGNKISSTASGNIKYNREDEQYFTTNKRSKKNSKRFSSDIKFNEDLSFESLDRYMQFRTRSLAGDYPSKVRKISTGEYWELFH